MPTLSPAITTATGTLAKTYRKGGPLPSTSKKQHRFMEAVAHGMTPRKGGPSQAVAKDFTEADKEVGAFQSSVKKRSGRIQKKRGRQ